MVTKTIVLDVENGVSKTSKIAIGKEEFWAVTNSQRIVAQFFKQLIEKKTLNFMMARNFGPKALGGVYAEYKNTKNELQFTLSGLSEKDSKKRTFVNTNKKNLTEDYTVWFPVIAYLLCYDEKIKNLFYDFVRSYDFIKEGERLKEKFLSKMKENSSISGIFEDLTSTYIRVDVSYKAKDVQMNCHNKMQDLIEEIAKKMDGNNLHVENDPLIDLGLIKQIFVKVNPLNSFSLPELEALK